MPSTPIAWREVWIDAVVTAILFEIGKQLIGLHLGKSGVTESFLAAGSLAALIAGVHDAAQILWGGRRLRESMRAGAVGRASEAAANASDFGRKTWSTRSFGIFLRRFPRSPTPPPALVAHTGLPLQRFSRSCP